MNEKSDIAKTLTPFEFKGIKKFYDISGLIAEPVMFRSSIYYACNHFKHLNITKIVAIDARGFIFGAPMALDLNIPLVMARKKGKLPGEGLICSESYDKEYQEKNPDVLCIPAGSIGPEDNVLIFDDIVATGGTLSAVIEIVKSCKPKSVHCGCVVELKALEGRKKLDDQGHKDVSIWSLIDEEYLN